MRARACSSSWGGRETRAFYFSVCVLSVASASSGTRTAQEWRGRKQKTQAKFVPSSCENQGKGARKTAKNRAKFGEKSMKNRSWLVLGVQSRSGGASERVRDGPGRRQSRAGSDLGTPRASQERPGDAQERARDGPKTLPGPSRATSECVRRDNHSQTRHRNDFSSILSCRAIAPMC